jgi:acetoacetate decarboxylase
VRATRAQRPQIRRTTLASRKFCRPRTHCEHQRRQATRSFDSLTSPTYPQGPYKFVNREFLIVTYRTDAKKLRELVPEPLEIDMDNPLVKFEFIRMPDSSGGFGDYTESGQVIP